MENKKIYLILVILILIVILIRSPSSPTNEYKSFIISGKINPSQNSIKERPKYVSIYSQYSEINHLCRDDETERSNIKWFNETAGSYSIEFKVPVGLKEVLLTTNCASCENKIVILNEPILQQDLVWGAPICEGRFQLTENSKIIRERASNVLDELGYHPFESTQIPGIEDDVERGRDAIRNSENPEDYSQSLLQAYYALWFARRARYKIELVELENCIFEVHDLLNEYKNKCYVPDYRAYIAFNVSNKTYSNSIENRLLDDYPFDISDIAQMKREVEYLYEEKERIQDAQFSCGQAFEVIKGTFGFQRPYCESENIVQKIKYFIWIIIFIYVGILIEKGILWKKKK